MGKLAVGIMTGTSLDGIDVALAEIDGFSSSTHVAWLGFQTVPYKPADLDALQRILREPVDIRVLSSLHNRLGHAYAEAVIDLCAAHGLKASDLNFIASHGQTVCHLGVSEEPYVASTLQIGDGTIIAQRCQTDVVSDFRTADMALGGQGAPLVPYADQRLFSVVGRGRIMQNIGGIANLTMLPRSGQTDAMLAFDTGPGGMLVDAATRYFFGKPYDEAGEIARSGHADAHLLSWLHSHPFFKKKPPKSAGREQFGQAYFHEVLSQAPTATGADVVATLTRFTVETIIAAYEKWVFPVQTIDDVIVSGGGAYNLTMLNQLQAGLPRCSVMPLETLGFNSKAKEAMCFIVLGNETLHGQPANVPHVTGASRPAILGKISRYR